VLPGSDAARENFVVRDICSLALSAVDKPLAVLQDWGEGGVLRIEMEGRRGAGATKGVSASLCISCSFRADRSNMEDDGDVGGEVNAVRLDFELELEREWDFIESKSWSDEDEDDDEEDDNEIADA
jgi:hypothetical protein